MKINYIPFLLILAACNAKQERDGFKRTESGITYAIFPSATPGAVVEKNSIIKVHLQQWIGDSMMNSTYNSMPEYVRIDSSLKKFDYVELLPLMRIGDSAVAHFPVSEIRKHAGRDAKLPDFLLKAKEVTVRFRIVDQFHVDSIAMKDFGIEQDKMDAMERSRDKEGYAIAKARFDSIVSMQEVAPNKINDHVYMSLLEKGKGEKIVKGMEVSIVHKGFTESGEVFESTTADKPYSLHVDEGESIEGINEALLQMRVGDKAKIFIGAPKAYGPRKAGKLPPFSNLIFEIQVLKAEKHD